MSVNRCDPDNYVGIWILSNPCINWCAPTDSIRQLSDPKMSTCGVRGVLMEPKGLIQLLLKSRGATKGCLSFLRTADQ